MKQELVKLANHLDSLGHRDLADRLDEILNNSIKKVARQGAQIPGPINSPGWFFDGPLGAIDSEGWKDDATGSPLFRVTHAPPDNQAWVGKLLTNRSPVWSRYYAGRLGRGLSTDMMAEGEAPPESEAVASTPTVLTDIGTTKVGRSGREWEVLGRHEVRLHRPDGDPLVLTPRSRSVDWNVMAERINGFPAKEAPAEEASTPFLDPSNLSPEPEDSETASTRPTAPTTPEEPRGSLSSRRVPSAAVKQRVSKMLSRGLGGSARSDMGLLNTWNISGRRDAAIRLLQNQHGFSEADARAAVAELEAEARATSGITSETSDVNEAFEKLSRDFSLTTSLVRR